MKLLVLCLALAVCVYGQSNQDCRPFELGQWPYYRYPPNHGTFGSCSSTIPHLGSCSFTCDSDALNHWTLVGNPYTCTDGEISGGPQWCRFDNYVSGAANCTVSPWWASEQTDCSSQCGGGHKTYTRNVVSYGEPGGEPCPTLAYEVPCGDRWCHDRILDRGYYYWGPFCAGATARTVNYYVHTWEDIDLYVFDEANFNRYTWDSALSTPQNAYYSPVQAYLTTNFEKDDFTVPPNKCYYLVLDNTAVGPTKGNNGQYDDIYFEFAINGVTPVDGFSDFSYQKGLYQPAAAVRSSSISFFGVFLTAIVLLILKLE